MPDWIVTAEESGQRLSFFLKNKLGSHYSARQIKQAIECNACFINGRVERFASSVVGKGDRVLFEAPAVSVRKEAAKVLYEDDFLLAIDKPAGISSEDPALKPLAASYLLHRLDKDTTGVLLWAKTKKAEEAFLELFKKRLIKKAYLAVVDGIPSQETGSIKNELGRLHQYVGQSLWGVVDKGLPAITHWKLKKKLQKASVILCHPLTGRTHQVRVHLNGLGHPILGDKQYGKQFTCKLRPSRCLLHAWKVGFIHPITGENVEIEAELPQDFKQAITALETS